MIGREACFYNCMETREISRLADLISKRKQNNFNTHCNPKKMCDNTSFDDRIKETQDKKGILDKKKRKRNYFVVKLTKTGQPIEWILC